MGSFNDYWENKVLDHTVGKTDIGALPTAYVGLCSADPTDSGTGSACNEISGGAYARVSTAAGDWNAAAAGSISNANAITFPQATGDWTTVTHFIIADAATLGNLHAHGSLSASKTVQNGDTASFAAGQITITLD
jgi:hypothetical protein